VPGPPTHALRTSPAAAGIPVETPTGGHA
jgi:hypothetical protein